LAQSLALTSAPADPYPEDKAPVQREPASLRPPVQRSAFGRVPRGAIIGQMRATDVTDLAITGTLFEAAKYQALRRARGHRKPGLLVRASDLRSYRRAAPPERLLVMLLDYTALRGWKEWGAAVLPYLKDAYTGRAAVGIVQVGAAANSPADELRARRVLGRSILARPVGLALQADAGRATPLAHGLDLAFETLRHALQHGRSRALQATLVVVTDGRGNVTLEASRTGESSGSVGDAGVKSAREVARRFRELDHVDAVLIHPGPKVYPELPVELAEALGARLRGARQDEDGPKEEREDTR
jgi:magnesium chelatase subunit D